MKFCKKLNNIIFNNWRYIDNYLTRHVLRVDIFRRETDSFHRWATFERGYPGQKNARSFGKLFSSSSKVLNGTTRPGCPEILPHYRSSDFFPSSHIVPRTTNSGTSVVSVKQPLFHLVHPEYPRALSCSISKCRSYLSTPFSPILFLRSSRTRTCPLLFLSLSHSPPLSLTSRAVYPHYFFLIPSSRHHRLPTWRRHSTGKRRSIEYRLRSIWNARNERSWSRQSCVRYDVSKEKTVNSTRKTGQGKGDGRDIELTAKSFPIRSGTIRRYGNGERMVEWRKQFASCKSVTRNTVLSTKNFSSTDYDNCCLYYVHLRRKRRPFSFAFFLLRIDCHVQYRIDNLASERNEASTQNPFFL